MEKEQTFSIATVMDTSTGCYVMKDYEVMRDIVVSYVKGELAKVTSIESESAYKEAKSIRTDIRKKKDIISQGRIQANALLLGDFNAQLKSLEEELNNADLELKAKINAYEDENKAKADKPKLMTLVIKGYSKDAIEKLRLEAIALNMSAEVK